MSRLRERLADIQRRIAAAAGRSGRPATEVTLLAVSKTFPVEALLEAHAEGQRAFGESRQQEAEPKIAALPADIDWHFIGKLQRNKVRKVVCAFGTIHSVDSVRLAQAIDRVAGEEGRRPRVFLEYNVAGESSKGGLTNPELADAAAEILSMPHLKVRGLMAIPPVSEDPEKSRGWFQKVREARDDLAKRCGEAMPELSMGMSEDFEIAIEEGATIVRIGSAIFGERDYSE